MKNSEITWMTLLSVFLMNISVCNNLRGELIGRFINVQPVAGLNSAYKDCCLAVSPNGSMALFSSTRPGGYGSFDIYQATWSSINQQYENVTHLGPELNTSESDSATSFSADGSILYFSSNGLSGEGSYDIFSATQSEPDQPFGNVTNLGRGVNTVYRESGPSVSEDGMTLYFRSDRPGSEGGRAIWSATRESVNDPFTDAALVLSDANAWITAPSISADGLTLFYAAQTVNSYGLRVTTRDSISDVFELGINLNDFSLGSSINSPNAATWSPRISSNWPAVGSKLYFNYASSNDWQIYEATWSPLVSNADFNEDGNVNSSDFDLWQTYFGRIESAIHINGDANGDGNVDGNDFLIWQRDYGMTMGMNTFTNAVPEPETIAYFFTFTLFVLGWYQIQMGRSTI